MTGKKTTAATTTKASAGESSTARTTTKTAETTQPVSTDPQVRTAAETVDPTLAPPKAETVEIVAPATTDPAPVSAADQVAQASAQVAAAATTDSGAVDPQAAAIAGRARREALEAQKQNAGPDAASIVPAGGIVRQIEDGAVTDRRAGAAADRSLAGENLPALRKNEPDPRQGVTTGDLTNPGVRDGEDAEQVTFTTGYSLYNRGEKASFSRAEAERLRGLGVAE